MFDALNASIFKPRKLISFVVEGVDFSTFLTAHLTDKMGMRPKTAGRISKARLVRSATSCGQDKTVPHAAGRAVNILILRHENFNGADNRGNGLTRLGDHDSRRRFPTYAQPGLTTQSARRWVAPIRCAKTCVPKGHMSHR